MTGRGARTGGGATGQLAAALHSALLGLAGKDPAAAQPGITGPESAGHASNAWPGRILIGFSGGRDSTVLVHLAATQWPGQVHALHVNHGLHPDSDHWQERCETVCRVLGTGLVTTRVPVAPGSNLEARARRARYDALAVQMQRHDCLLLAHHSGDQLESRLLHLFQGRGLYGIPVRRAFAGGYILRPFLDLPPELLDSYAREHRLTWIQDPSNEDRGLDRNFLRHEVLPRLEARFPHLDRRLNRVQAQLSTASGLLDDLLGLDRYPLPLDVFAGRSAEAQQLILRAWLIRLERSRGFSDAALADFVRQLTAPDDRQPELRQDSTSLRRYRDSLYLVEAPPRLADAYRVQIPGRLVLPHGTLLLDRTAAPDSGLTETADSPGGETVEVRFLATLGAGARVPKLKVRGRSRSVSELLRAAGIPPWERSGYPLLMDPLGLLAIPGIGVRDSGAGAEPLRCVWQPLRGDLRGG